MTLKTRVSIDLSKILWIITGILITMPVFTLPVGNLALYNIPFMAAILYQPLKDNFKVYLYKYKIVVYAFLLILLLSSLMSWYIVYDEWYATSIRGALKLSLIFLLFLLLHSDQNILDYRRYFETGLLWAVPIQFVWLILQSLSWNLAHIKLNTVVFGVNVYNEGIDGITLTGLSWERADTALLFAIATALSRNVYIRAMSIIGIVLTSSRSGLVLVLMIYAYEFLKSVINSLKHMRIRYKTLKLCVIVILCLIVAIIVLQFVHISFLDSILNKLEQLMVRMAGLITDKSQYGTNQVDPHKLYFVWLPETLRQSTFLQLVLGSGTRISGWMYTQIFNRFPDYGPWDVECDFVALILGNGILGFILYYLMLIVAFVLSESEQHKKVIILFFGGSFLYHFFTSTLGLLMIVFSFNKLRGNLLCKRKSVSEIFL